MLMLGPMPEAVRAAVRRLIAENGPEFPNKDERLALTLHGGPSGCTYLDANGDVWRLFIAFDDEPEVIEQVLDGPAKVSDVAIAATQIPELAAWLPRRPEHATDCDVCKATGWFPPLPLILCPKCCGMGWIAE